MTTETGAEKPRTRYGRENTGHATMTTDKLTVATAVLAEVARTESIHPHWPVDFVHGAAIVAEEAGELVRAALNSHYHHADPDEMRTEAIHTAATAIRFLCNYSE